ncbi:MAG: MBL fold metallo-hydrolase [Thermoplasmata archaeon]|nr:MBL fold metallo-hydrolase [Thermoplasmata archaeon]
MRIVQHGHSCFEFADSGLTVVVDPHDGKSIGIKTPVVTADAVLMTHDHYDHCAARIVRGNHEDVMARDGEFEVKGLKVRGLPTFHDAKRGEERGRNTMYLFSMDGLSICHCGDLGAMPDDDVIAAIRGVDLLFVPVGEIFTMHLAEVREFIERVNPHIIVPMHYRVGGLSIPLTPLDDFLSMIPEDAVAYVGNEVDLMPEDLPEIKECWVFTS